MVRRRQLLSSWKLYRTQRRERVSNTRRKSRLAREEGRQNCKTRFIYIHNKFYIITCRPRPTRDCFVIFSWWINVWYYKFHRLWRLVDFRIERQSALKSQKLDVRCSQQVYVRPPPNTRRKCSLTASRAAPWWVTLSISRIPINLGKGWDRQTDGRTDGHQTDALRLTLDANIVHHHHHHHFI